MHLRQHCFYCGVCHVIAYRIILDLKATFLFKYFQFPFRVGWAKSPCKSCNILSSSIRAKLDLNCLKLKVSPPSLFACAWCSCTSVFVPIQIGSTTNSLACGCNRLICMDQDIWQQTAAPGDPYHAVVAPRVKISLQQEKEIHSSKCGGNGDAIGSLSRRRMLNRLGSKIRKRMISPESITPYHDAKL